MSRIEGRIQQALDEIAREENVAIVYACESGSRAWGFASTDSDYDVRFLYLHPAAWYLTIQERRDVIERPIDDTLDLSGWDLQKALKLFQKSNPPLMEWLRSPIVYRENEAIVAELRAQMSDYYSPVSAMHHYLHMAQGNYREYLRGDTVWLKKYFYVLRPILASMWIHQGRGVVPVEFDVLKNTILGRDALRDAIDELLMWKRSGEESDRGPRVPIINEFIEEQLSALAEVLVDLPAKKGDPDELDRIFQRALVTVWGDSVRATTA